MVRPKMLASFFIAPAGAAVALYDKIVWPRTL